MKFEVGKKYVYNNYLGSTQLQQYTCVFVQSVPPIRPGGVRVGIAVFQDERNVLFSVDEEFWDSYLEYHQPKIEKINIFMKQALSDGEIYPTCDGSLRFGGRSLIVCKIELTLIDGEPTDVKLIKD